MIVAPFEGCIACYAGDTRTLIQFRGEPNWLIAGLMKLGLEQELARGIVLAYAAEELGCEPGTAPPEMQATYRVCRKCAAKAKLPVDTLIIQP